MRQVMKSEKLRLSHEQNSMKERIKDNADKVKMNKQLPYLVGNIVEVRGLRWKGTGRVDYENIYAHMTCSC